MRERGKFGGLIRGVVLGIAGQLACDRQSEEGNMSYCFRHPRGKRGSEGLLRRSPPAPDSRVRENDERGATPTMSLLP